MVNSYKRICNRTGFGLSFTPGAPVRVANETRGPFDPPPRGESEGRGGWSRFDTEGRTIYACAEKATAFMELLAPYRQKISEHRRALIPLAKALGKDVDELWADIVTDWDQQRKEDAGWLPTSFRTNRAVYTIRFPSGWWIDATASETIAALSQKFTDRLTMLHEPLTMSHLTGGDRNLTTAIAAVLHDQVVLDDGTKPLGIEFLSKHGSSSAGSGICWAYWMSDDGKQSTSQLQVVSKDAIDPNDTDLALAQHYCGIRLR